MIFSGPKLTLIILILYGLYGVSMQPQYIGSIWHLRDKHYAAFNSWPKVYVMDIISIETLKDGLWFRVASVFKLAVVITVVTLE